MVDFWEVFGRMVTNDDFRKALYKNCPATPYRIGIEVPGFDNKGLDIPSKNYDYARKVVAGVITDGPVSLSTLGETLMILSSRHFRDLANTLAEQIQDCVNTGNGSKLFYIAIGCMMLDGQVFQSFADEVFDDIQFGGLTGLEQDALNKLATTKKVKSAANKACFEFWSIACSDDYAYYPPQGNRKSAFVLKQGEHMHPIVQPYPPPDGKKGSAAKERIAKR